MMDKPISRTYGSALWTSLEDRWIKAKAEAEAAQAELKDVEGAMQKEIKRRGDTPDVLGDRVDIDGTKLEVQYRLNAGRVTIDSRRLRNEKPDVAEEYSKEGSPFFTLKPKVKIAAAAEKVA
jgi:hypothetical protein